MSILVIGWSLDVQIGREPAVMVSRRAGLA